MARRPFFTGFPWLARLTARGPSDTLRSTPIPAVLSIAKGLACKETSLPVPVEGAWLQRNIASTGSANGALAQQSRFIYATKFAIRFLLAQRLAPLQHKS